MHVDSQSKFYPCTWSNDAIHKHIFVVITKASALNDKVTDSEQLITSLEDMVQQLP